MWARCFEGYYGMKKHQSDVPCAGLGTILTAPLGSVPPDNEKVALPGVADLLSCDELSGLGRKEADLKALILASQGIEVSWEDHNGLYDLKVDAARLPQVHNILLQYYSENSSQAGDSLNRDPPLPRLTPGGKAAAILACLLLCLIHASAVYHGNHHQVVLDYGASALYILQGEYYRTVTALMLHSDFEHLAGNVLGLLFFGIPLCSIMGPGRGLFLILLSGTAGNLINAYMYRRAHLSIGASTAVMGAVGILVLWQMRKRVVKMVRRTGDAAKNGHSLERIDIKPSILFPLGAGAAFVGMFSGGENTDVAAHVFGFLSGLGVAMLFLYFSTLFRGDISSKTKNDPPMVMDNIFIFIVVAITLLAWFKF